MGGYLNFYAICPSPMKNQLLVQRIHYNEEHVHHNKDGTKMPIAFPIRGIDYDPVKRMLYTGDEMGYMMKWDLNQMLDKLEQVQADFNN